MEASALALRPWTTQTARQGLRTTGTSEGSAVVRLRFSSRVSLERRQPRIEHVEVIHESHHIPRSGDRLHGSARQRALRLPVDSLTGRHVPGVRNPGVPLQALERDVVETAPVLEQIDVHVQLRPTRHAGAGLQFAAGAERALVVKLVPLVSRDVELVTGVSESRENCVALRSGAL